MLGLSLLAIARNKMQNLFQPFCLKLAFLKAAIPALHILSNIEL